jgi:hypothetical protein
VYSRTLRYSIDLWSDHFYDSKTAPIVVIGFNNEGTYPWSGRYMQSAALEFKRLNFSTCLLMTRE